MASDQQTLSNVPETSVGAPGSMNARLRSLTTRLWRTLEYSSAYLALIAAAKVLIVMYILSLPLSPAPLVGALVTFAIYANDRIVDTESDSVSNPDRTAFVQRYQSELYVLAAVAYGLGVAVAALGGALAFGLTVLPGLLWVAYAVEWIQVNTVQVTRLKEIPVINSVLVAIAWAVPVVVLPVAFADATLTPTAGLLVLYFSFATFVNTEIANIRDVESDRASGVATMPTIVGVERTRVVLSALSLGTLVVLCGGVASGIVTVLSAAVLSTGVVCLVVILSLVERISNERLLALGAECTPVPVLLGLAVLAVLS
ncbi:UbiA family prenyltransferase [Halovenus marina]|uniref:UbiA family prenyltransferase n=1 Tax=Halovenus marina TaxID=3396621 RepID=UPI003F5617B8